MASKTDLDWTSVKFVFYDTGSNAKVNLYTLLKFIDQRFVEWYQSIYYFIIILLLIYYLDISNVKILALISIFF